MMRIWIFNHYATTPDEAAGTRHYDISRVLAAKGHDVTIFASSFNHSTLREERLKGNERARVEYIDGIRFVWIRTTPYSGNDARRALNMLSYSMGTIWEQRRMSRPDVVVGCSVHPAAAAAGWLIASLRHVPFVLEIGDLWPHYLIDTGALKQDGVVAWVLRIADLSSSGRGRLIIFFPPRAQNT